MNCYKSLVIYFVVITSLYGNKILFELEAHQREGNPGQPLWFYVRFSANLFLDETKSVFYAQVISHNPLKTVQLCLTPEADHQKLPLELQDGTLIAVQAPREYRNVRIFQFTIAEEGNYSVYVRPQLTHTKKMKMKNLASVNITISSQFGGKECLETASFSVNDVDAVTIAAGETMLNPASPTHLKLTFKRRSCLFDKSTTYTWSVESVFYVRSKAGSIPRCINNKRVGIVDLTKLYSRITGVTLPVAMNKPTLFIQPYTLSPGTTYRICVLLQQNKTERILCTLIGTNSTKTKDLLFVKIDPPMNTFTLWPTDLIFNASKSFFLYMLEEAGYMGKKTITFSWSCSGNQNCNNIKSHFSINSGGTDVEVTGNLITNKASSIIIRRLWLQPASLLKIMLNVSVKYQMQVISRMVGWTITIPERYSGPEVIPHVFIRCLSNCQYYVNVRHPLRLGVGCRNCEEVTSRSVELKWSSTKPGGHIFNATQMYATIKVEPTVNLTEFRVTLTFSYFHRAEKIESVASRDFLTPGLTNFSVQTTRSHRMITTLWDDWGRTAQFSEPSRQPNQEVSTSLFQELSRSRVTLSSNNTAVPQSIHQRVTATQRNPVGQLVTEITTDRFRLIFRPYEVKSTALNVIFPLIYVLNVTTHLVLGQGTGANGFQILTTSSLDFYLPLNLAPTVNLKTVSSFGLYLSDSQDVTIPLNSDLKVTNLSDAFHKYFSNNDADITQLLFLLCQMIDSDLDISSQIKYVEFIYRHLIDPQHNLVDYSNFTVVLFLMKRLFYLLQKLIGWGHLNLFSFCDSSTYFLKIIRKILDMHNEHLDVPIYDCSNIYWQIIDILDDIKRNCDAAYKRNVHYLQAFNIGTDIFIILDIALQHCPFRLNQLSPLADSIVECCSFDSSQKRVLRLGSTHAYGYVYVETHTYSLLINDISIDPYIQMAVYGSHESSLSSRIGDLEINAPVMMIVIQQLSPLDYFLEEVYWEIFDIRLIPKSLTFDQKTFRIKLHTGLNRLGNRVVVDSDCLLLKFNASVMFGTQLFLRPSLDMIYTVSPIIVRSTRETLDIMDKGYVEMPRTYNETLRNITGDPTSLFLPQLSLEYLLAKDTKFYLLIRVKERHIVKGNDLLKLTVFCKRVTCGRWSSEDKSWTARNCRPSNMSMLTPEYINCRCDTGRIFSGGVEDCSSSMEVPWKDYAVMKTQWDGDPNTQSTYWYYVIFVWIVFLALLVWTYRRDRLDRPMGAVHVLPGLFTPYQSDQYLVCIVTGWMFGAGTLSTPLLTITDNEECGIYLLFPDQNLFQSGSEIWFLLSCPDNVQNLDKIIFSVGSAHYADDWHVSHIFMKHLNRDEELYCICDSWIPDLSNGFRFIVRPVTWTQGSAVRKFVFNVIRMFRTLHVFIGTFYNVPGSHFSKSQHALCLLFHVILNLFVCLSLAEDAKLDLQGDRNTKKNERAAGNFSTLFIFSVTVTSLLSFSVVAWFEMLDYLSLTRAKLRYPHDINYRNKVTNSASSLASGNHLNNISQKSSTVYSRGYLSSKPDRSSNVDKNAASFSKDWLPTANLDISQNKGYSWWGGFSQSDHQSDVTSESTFASGSTPSILSERARQLTKSLLAKPRMDSRRTALKKRTMIQVENYFKLRELERTFLGSKVDIHADAESLAGTFSDFMDNLGLAEDAAFRASFRSFLPNLLQLVSNLLLLSVTLVLSVRLIYASLSLKDNSRVKALFWMTLPFSLCVVHPILILILTAMLTNRDLIGISLNAERRLRGINSQLVFHMKMASQCYVEKSRYVPKNRCYFRKNKKDRHRRYCQFFVKKYGAVADALGIFSVTHFSKRKSQFIFIVLVIVVINVQLGSVRDRYMQTTFIRRLLQVGRNEITLEQSLTVADVWSHIRQRLYLMTHWNLVDINTTASFHVLSSARLRQVRVVHDDATCKNLLPVNDTQYCHYDIEQSIVDTKTYAWTWMRPIQRTTSPGPFSFTEGEHFNTLIHSYPGGGYDVIFTHSDRIPVKIDQVNSRMWVDERTRAIKVDMALFNADTQLMTSVSHVYEFTGAGIFQNTLRVYTFPLYYLHNTQEVLRMCYFFMVLLTLYFAAKEIIEIRTSGIWNYFSDPMSWLNLLERGTSITVIAGFTYEYFYRSNAIQKVKTYFSTREEQRVYFDFSDISNIAIFITQMCCILAIVTFIKILLKTSTFASVSKFLELIPPVLKNSYLVVMAVITYACFGFFIFSEDGHFYTFTKSVYSVTELLLNPGLLKSLIRTYQVIAPVYITLTVSVMKYVLINYFITFLNEEYSRICTAMRMRFEGKKAFLLEEVIKYLTRKQKTQAVDSGETRDATRKEGKQARQILEDMLEEAKTDFDLVKWANALEDRNPVIT